ncbi:MAG: NAD-dependent epimerase/dehydratase family protein [Alphaproteobacteria bacterium]|nr:NAD-dependent epimerase/dehydratase family protein [Alphaproteobacteria bacterium]
MNILVTGANGFVGQALCAHIPRHGFNAYGLLRKKQENLTIKKQFIVEDFLKHSDWEPILKGMDAVIHAAGLAHVKSRPDKDYYEINTEITKKLALECVKFNVKRFVYISSLAVYGVSSSQDVVALSTPLNPKTPYGHSKLSAEKFLQNLHETGTLEIVIVRPPLVYGPRVSGNVLTLLKSIQKGIPFPFAGTKNKRSMVFVQNLADALVLCASHPKAKGHTFFVSDNHPLSIGEFIQGLAEGMGKKANLFYLPEFFLKTPFKLIGKSEYLKKITGSLQLDISSIQKTLGWKPLVSVEEGLRETARSFQSLIGHPL